MVSAEPVAVGYVPLLPVGYQALKDETLATEEEYDVELASLLEQPSLDVVLDHTSLEEELDEATGLALDPYSVGEALEPHPGLTY